LSIRRLTSLSVLPSSTSGLTTANGYITPSLFPAPKTWLSRVGTKKRAVLETGPTTPAMVSDTASASGSGSAELNERTHARVLIAHRSARRTCRWQRVRGRGGRLVAVMAATPCSCLLQWR
jgi:hypothetical protein